MKRHDQAPECDMCAGNRQLLDAIRQELADLRSHITASPARALEAMRVDIAQLAPDDYLVFTSALRLCDEEISALMDHIKHSFPGIKAIVLDRGLQVAVIHPDGAQ